MNIFAIILLYVFPKNLLSRIVGFIVHLELFYPLNKWSISWFANRYKINLNEAEFGIEHYKSIGNLFTRRLKNNCRPIAEGKVIHPVDAVISQAAKISENKLIQAKSKNYDLAELLGSEDIAKSFKEPVFLTYYLCPTDYHRIHFSMDAKVLSATHIPGKLWPVNEWSVNKIENLFAINERVVVNMESEEGHKASCVLVGATNVGKISLSFEDEIISNQFFKREVNHKIYTNELSKKKADELGIFHMGSTVVMVYDGALVNGDLPLGPCKMGEKLF